jgi:hypothetical protein
LTRKAEILIIADHGETFVAILDDVAGGCANLWLCRRRLIRTRTPTGAAAGAASSSHEAGAAAIA